MKERKGVLCNYALTFRKLKKERRPNRNIYRIRLFPIL